MIKFDKVIREACIVQPTAVCQPGTPSIDTRCADPAFRIANPDLCKGFNRLIVKPDNIILCNLQNTKFRAFLVADGMEEIELTNGITWQSSDLAVVQISSTNGQAMGVGMGIATVSAAWNGLEGSAYVNVLPECCAERKTGIVLLIDNSESMNQKFSTLHGTKLAFAKKLAYDYVGTLNLDKDEVSILSFDNGAVIARDFTNDVSLLQTAITAIPMTGNTTDIADALQDAVDQVDSRADIDTKVIIIFSDGFQTSGGAAPINNPEPIAEAFKSRAGFIVAVGMRAFGDGFDLLEKIASAGFFINGHTLTEPHIANWLSGLSGYFCSGDCTPPGDVVLIGHGKLNYDAFANFVVVGRDGRVDLIGGDPAHPEYDVFNILPGNGLYVDLRGTPGTGGLRTRQVISFVTGNRYRITLRMAGTQRHPGQEDFVEAKILDLGLNAITSHTFGPILNTDDFSDFQLEWIATSTFQGYVEIDQVPSAAAWWDCGALLDRVLIEEEWITTDAHIDTLLVDDFDGENGGLVPPACPENLIISPLAFSPTIGGFGYAYDCPGYGCLSEPVPGQVPDPYPLPRLDEGEEGSGMGGPPGGGPGPPPPPPPPPPAVISYLAAMGDTMQGNLNMGLFTLSFGGDAGGFCVYQGNPYLKHPTLNQWHRLRPFMIDNATLLDIDQTGVVIDFSDVPAGTGLAPYVPLTGGTMQGGIDMAGFKTAFGLAGGFAVFGGNAYLRHPTLNQYHRLRAVAFDGAILLDVDQAGIALTFGDIPTGAQPGPYLSLAGGTMQGSLSLASYKLSFSSGSFAAYQGSAYIKSGIEFHRLRLVVVDLTILLDLVQTPTTIP